MAYHVEIAPTALLDAQDAFDWMEQHSPTHVDEWFNGLMDAVFSLDEMPRRCSLAPENDFYEQETRHLLYTKRRVTYRIIFVILQLQTEEEEGILRVFRIQHGAQHPLTAGEFKQGERD